MLSGQISACFYSQSPFTCLLSTPTIDVGCSDIRIFYSSPTIFGKCFLLLITNYHDTLQMSDGTESDARIDGKHYLTLGSKAGQASPLIWPPFSILSYSCSILSASPIICCITSQVSHTPCRLRSASCYIPALLLRCIR
jgi:hypothetical protein